MYIGEVVGCVVASVKEDFVFMIGSKEAARMFRKTVPAADSAIVGFIDSYNVRIKE